MFAFQPQHVDKPWGLELIWAHSDQYVGKLLFVRAGQALSLQFHREKDESWYVQSGRAKVELGEVGEAVLVEEVVTAGSALISVAVPLTQELTHVGPALGAMVVCLISLFNGMGRLFWGTLSDRIGRPSTFLALFLLQAPAFMLLPAAGHFAAFLVPVAVVALCFGGGFGVDYLKRLLREHAHDNVFVPARLDQSRSGHFGSEAEIAEVPCRVPTNPLRPVCQSVHKALRVKLGARDRQARPANEASRAPKDRRDPRGQRARQENQLLLVRPA